MDFKLKQRVVVALRNCKDCRVHAAPYYLDSTVRSADVWPAEILQLAPGGYY